MEKAQETLKTLYFRTIVQWVIEYNNRIKFYNEDRIEMGFQNSIM